MYNHHNFENRQDFLQALDGRLRHAHETGNPSTRNFRSQRARLQIESIEPPVEFEFYKPGRFCRGRGPKLAGELAVAGLVLEDEDRELFSNYAVVKKRAEYYGVPADLVVITSLAKRTDLYYEPVPSAPPIPADPISSRFSD